MKTTAYMTLLYSLIVILGGIMSFRYADMTISLFVEVFLGIILFISSLFMLKEMMFSFYSAAILSLLLAIFYGYNFSQTHLFFQGIMSAISIFIFVFEIIKIFRISSE